MATARGKRSAAPQGGIDRLARRALQAASRGEKIPTLQEVVTERAPLQTKSSRMRNLALAMVEARNQGLTDLTKAENLDPILASQGISRSDYWDIVSDPDFWPVLGSAAISTSPGQYLEAFMTMAEQAASGESSARTAFFSQMKGIMERGMGEEERYLATLDEAGIQREATRIHISLSERLDELRGHAAERKKAAEEQVLNSLTEVLDISEKLREIPADALGIELPAHEDPV